MFRRSDFRCNIRDVNLDSWSFVPPQGWAPDDSLVTPLEEVLPFCWGEEYRNIYQQYFQPNVFYNNCLALTNYALAHPEHIEPTRRIVDRLFRRMLSYTQRYRGALFIRNDFDFITKFDNIPSGWVGGIMSAFVLSGLLRVMDVFDPSPYEKTVVELAAAYKIVHRAGEAPPDWWFSYVDKDGYLWFDEYPLPNGETSLVLNGHIFSIFALALYVDRTGDTSLTNYLNAGILTIKDRAMDFRNPGEVNSYMLRNRSKPDYGPGRTVRQQVQLFKLTRDEAFKRHATNFYHDMKHRPGVYKPYFVDEEAGANVIPLKKAAVPSSATIHQPSHLPAAGPSP